MKTPSMSVPFVAQGARDAMLTDVGLVGIPITIAGGTRIVTQLKGPRLYARATASPYKARPFQTNTVIINPTNTTNATIDVADADAIKFKVGDTLTYYDVSAAGLYAGAALTLDIIGAAGSGGTGETLLTFTGEVWTTPPVAGDFLMVADGTELSANACVVFEDIEFDGTSEFLATGYISGVFNKSLVNGVTYFDQTKAPNLQMILTQG